MQTSRAVRLALLLLAAALALSACGSDSASPEDTAQDASSELATLLEPLPEDEQTATKDVVCDGIRVGYSAGDWKASIVDPELRAAVMEIQDTLAETEGANTAFVESSCS
jgi:hypothetical protein